MPTYFTDDNRPRGLTEPFPSNSPLLFLDFDGVLQTPAWADWREMALCSELEQLLRELPSLRVVVTSTHREGRTLEGIRAMLPHAVAAKVVGTTPVQATGRADGGRQIEIETWLSAHPDVTQWVAVDDEARLYTRGCAWLVQTSKYEGWDELVTSQVRAALGVRQR